MAKSKDRGAGTGGRDQKKKPQKTIKEKRAAKKTKGRPGLPRGSRPGRPFLAHPGVHPTATLIRPCRRLPSR